MKHLRVFETETNYNSAVSEFEYPTVSLIQDTEEVRYMTVKDKYVKEYLTFEALEAGTFTFTMTSKLSTTCVPSISYSIDNGETWSTTANVNDQEVVVTTPTIAQGNKVLWKSSATQFCVNTDSYPGSRIGYGSFTSTGNYNVSGNIMSLLYSDNFSGRVDLPTPQYGSNYYGNGVFGFLFGRDNTKLVSAENLILPATNLTGNCYTYMFNQCTSLTTAPELPATTLVNSCYSGMFYGCTSLTTAPELKATTLANQCYQSMFNGCTALVNAPKLPATTLVSGCYQQMFAQCTSLTSAPTLPATTLVDYCYQSMFSGCTQLNYIKAMFTTTPSMTYTRYWVENVAASGTFVKNSAAQWNVTGVNGVPTGWTVQTASA